MTGRDDPPPIRLEPHPADDRLALLRLDRPPVNAFDQRMWDLFADVTASLHGDTLYRAVVITGGPRHFAAGADVKEMLGLDPAEFGARNRVLQGAFHALATAPQVTIAAVSGYALGGGCELALAADFRFAGRSAVFGLPEITLGIIPGSGGTQRLPRRIGLAKAIDFIANATTMPPAQAKEAGLVDRLFPDAAACRAGAIEYAAKLAEGPSVAIGHAKLVATLGYGGPLDVGLALEREAIGRVFVSEDADEGIKAFSEKRKAAFKGK